MPQIDSLHNEILKLRKEIKRLNKMTKVLREKKKIREKAMYETMIKKDIDKYGDITIKSIKPRSLKPRKKLEEKKKDAFELFINEGIINPEDFWEKFVKTQKVIVETS